MLHKQIVFAAIAVTALMGLIVPLSAVPAANAQVDAGSIVDGALDAVFGDDEEAAAGDGDGDGGASGDDSQNIDQDASNEAEVEQEVEQSADETNNQANVIETGDNDATVAQSNDDQRVEAAAAAESGDAEAEAEDEDNYKHSKDHSSDTDTTTADADSIASAVATATGTQTNTATVDQDSSADDNVQVNENEFGDDTLVAVPISDIDQTAENRAINLDLDDEYGQVVDGGDDDDLGIDPDVLECLQLPPGQVRQCIEDLELD